MSTLNRRIAERAVYADLALHLKREEERSEALADLDRQIAARAPLGHARPGARRARSAGSARESTIDRRRWDDD